MLPPLLELRGVTVYRGETLVFDELDLVVEQGRSTAILGPNGSGKTTLLLLLQRELYPVHRDGSYLRILGREHWDVFELRRRLGVVSPDLSRRLAYHGGDLRVRRLRVLDVVLSGFVAAVGAWGVERLGEAEREAAAQSLAEMGISELRDRTFRELSSGEQRRVLLARALVHRPEALVLDEPTANLDLLASHRLLERIRGLARGPRSMMLVTHDLSEVGPEMDDVVLLRGPGGDGARGRASRVLARGAPGEVLTSEALSELYGTRLQVMERDGHYRVVPQ